MEDFKRTIEQFANLPEDWDGYGGMPPSEAAIANAQLFLALIPTDIPPTHIGVAGNGEIIFFWETARLFADFGIDDNIENTYAYFIKDSLTTRKLYGDERPLSEGIDSGVIAMLRECLL